MVPFHHTEKGQVVEVQLEADKDIEVEAWLETETFHSLDLLLCTKRTGIILYLSHFTRQSS